MSSLYATYPSLRDRTVLITGGASGIGEFLVEAFAQQGSSVLFLDIQDEPAQALITRLQPNPPTYYHCDLTDTPHPPNPPRHTPSHRRPHQQRRQRHPP